MTKNKLLPEDACLRAFYFFGENFGDLSRCGLRLKVRFVWLLLFYLSKGQRERVFSGLDG